MGGETADDSEDGDDEEDERNSLVWESVGKGDAPSGSDDSPPEPTDAPAGTDDEPADTGGETGKTPEPEQTSDTASESETVDLEALIAEEPTAGEGRAQETGGGSEPEETDATDRPGPTQNREERAGSDDTGAPEPGQTGKSDRLWNRFGSAEDDERDQSGGSSDAGSEPGETGKTEETATRDDDRLWNRDEQGATESPSESKSETRAGSVDRGGGEGGGREGATDGDEEPSKRGTSFDHLLERSGSGSGNTRPVGSPSVETDLDAFFGDLEEFDRATSGSQVLVISPRGHSITDEVCSQFLTAGGVSGRNAMFVTAVESPSERVDICRNSDDWTGGKVAVIELGDTGSEADDALAPVGGEEVVHKRVNSPKNLSKTGLLITQTLKQWSSSDQPSILCFHSLTAVGGYVQNETLFQFLFTLQAKLNSFGVTGHYHMDANKHDQQEINTLKTLFDLVVTISRDGDIEVE